MMPLKIENTLNNYKVSILGKNPPDRGSYDPSQALSTIKGGDTILVEDSLNLPPDWKDHNLGGIIRMTDQEPPCGEATNDKVHKYT